MRLIDARGLAPNVTKRERSPRPTDATSRVAFASLTAYSIRAGSTKTPSAACCSRVSCSASTAFPAWSGAAVCRSTITNSSVGVG
jgi:hypothetical protein